MLVLFIFSLLTLVSGAGLCAYSSTIPRDYRVFYFVVGLVYLTQGVVGCILSKSNLLIIGLREKWALYFLYLSLNILNSSVGLYSFVQVTPWNDTYEWEAPLLYMNLSLYFISIIVHFTVSKVHFKHQSRSREATYVLVKVK